MFSAGLAFVRRALVSAAVVALAGCGAGHRGATDPPPRATTRADGSVTSNILRSDYAGSRSCEPCHADVYAAWEKSPMHRMTRVPENTEIRAPFDGRSFRFKEDAVTLSEDGGRKFVAISSRSFGDHVYRVTRVIGGRYREDFAGVEVLEPRAQAKPVKDPRNELVLPVTFVYSPPSFRLKGYSVMVAERPGLKAGGVWNQTCIFCHNVAPYFSSLLGELAGPSAPGYQGEVVDRVLPRDRRSALSVEHAGDLARAANAELRFLGAGDAAGDDPGKSHPFGCSPGASTGDASSVDALVRATKRNFDASHLVELGVGCESCHGGSREHVADVAKKPSFEIRSSFVRALPSPWEAKHAANERTRAVDRVCARCHQVLFSRYPFTWEGARRSDDPGGSHISSGEARDYLLGGCSSAMACTTCHDPHAADSQDKLRALETPQGNGVCVGCHTPFREPAALRAHAHHDPAGAGAACVSCHMPKKNMGLGYGLSRYHRIGSPTDKARVEGDRPLECALCHVDKSVGELVSSMERNWGKRYDRAALATLYGDLGASPLLATLTRGKAHEQATAMYVLGERHIASALAPIAEALVHPFPLVRYYARDALSKIANRPCDVNLDQDEAAIRADTARWFTLGHAPSSH